MSIIIQFNSPSYNLIQSPKVACRSKTVKVEMVPGIEHSDIPVMTDEKGLIIDTAKNGVFPTSLKDVRTSHYCFGLPYQDHNYGAPPPPTPPSYSPCPSPAAVVAIVEEDTNHSVVSTTTEEAPEESITRCICGFEHDDEYMICCDNCLVWQHIDCMGLDRNNIPENYLCEKCEPRKLDKHKAKLLQARKKNVLTKLPPSKQESSANNLVFGKNYKKKTLPHSSEQWNQGIPNATQLQRYNGSTDTDEESSKQNERRPKTRSKRRKKEEEKEIITKKSKLLAKNGKERMEIRRSRLRRSNKESTSTADEEAQDAWVYSKEWCEENFESAVTNQYTAEVQLLARMMRPAGFEKKFYDQLQSKQCHVLDDGKKKQLVSLYDIPRNQPLIEYKGKYLLASQFHDLHPLYNKRLYPYIMFYKVEDTEICVDSSMYGNNARFVRRSCKPNAEMNHMSYNGNLHLFLQSTKVIFSEDEITVPLNFNPMENIKDIICACGSEDCFMKPKKRNGSVEIFPEKRRRSRRYTISAEEDNSQSIVAVATTPEKQKFSPVKAEIPEPPVFHSEVNEQVIEMKIPSENETEDHSVENKKKMTREQRKIEAYMRAFNQMEKAQRRRQQAIERQKAQQPKSEDTPEKIESTESVSPREEEKPPVEPEVAAKEEPIEEVVKVQQMPVTPKPKKGKRRRGSGTPSRRRTRTNSGGSDILPSLEEVKQVISESTAIPEPSPADSIPEPVMEPVAVAPPVTVLPPTSPVPSPASEESPKALKTKKLLLHEWIKEKSEEAISTASSSSPRSIHPEPKWNTPTDSAKCFVLSSKDTLPSGGNFSVHLRRNSSSTLLRPAASQVSNNHSKVVVGQGSAKKRWLRQAMHDCSDEPIFMDTSSLEHLDNSCFSPNCHGDVDSPVAATDDILTPLKKRRLMRESIESLSSPHSPSLDNGMDDTDATTSSLTTDTQIDQRIDTIDQQLLCATNDNSMQLSSDQDNTVYKEDKFVLADDSESKEDIVDNETRFETSPMEVVCTKDDCDSDECEPFKVEETSVQNECQATNQTCSLKKQELSEDHLLVNGDISGLNASTLSSTIAQDNSSDFKSSTVLECQDNSIKALEDVPVTLDAIAVQMQCSNSPNQSVKTINIEDENVLAQKQPSDSCAVAVASSPVHKLSPIEIKCTSPISHVIEATSLVESKESIEHLPSGENHTMHFQPILQEAKCNEKPSSEVHEEEAIDIDNHSINDRPSNLNVTSEEKVCSSDSSCSNLVVNCNTMHSVMENKKLVEDKNETVCKVNGAGDAQVQSIEEETQAKVCASATQKRKVSLSEYRMRMKENISKNRSDSTKSSVDGTLTTSENLKSKVTLAPLPLFGDIAKDQKNMQPTNKKKKDVSPIEEDSNTEAEEHRENLTERLKREFGFDLSEGPSSFIQAKSKSNNQTVSEPPSKIPTLPLDPQSLPPPPPPPRGAPRPIRAPQTTMGKVPVSIPSQYGFVHPPPFSRPPFIIPQVPGAPYIPPPQPILPSLHQLPPNSTTPSCSLRAPLLPPAHAFTASMPGTLLRTPTRHDYAPVNAQRFATMVPQHRSTHKAYPHVYPSGLYK